MCTYFLNEVGIGWILCRKPTRVHETLNGTYITLFRASLIVIHQDAKEIDLDKLGEVCGTNYCPGVDFPTLNTTKSGLPVGEDDSVISTKSLYILAAIYLACSLASAVVVALLVDPLTR